MTRNKAQKTATRQRMAETGEPYSVARHVIEDDQVPTEPPEPPKTGPNATARDDRWYARVAGEAGITVAEFKAQEEAARAADLAEEAQRRAGAAQERADQAQLAADRALAAAGLAQEQAEREQELADRAEEAADEAEARAEEFADESDDEDDEDGPADGQHGHWSWGQAGQQYLGHEPGLDWDRIDDLGDRMQANVARLRQRFDLARERAERLIGQAERIVNAAQSEPQQSDQG